MKWIRDGSMFTNLDYVKAIWVQRSSDPDFPREFYLMYLDDENNEESIEQYCFGSNQEAVDFINELIGMNQK